MNRNWCCREFEIHGQPAIASDGVQVIIGVNAKTGFFSFLHFWLPGKHLEDGAAAGVRIRFCPWCGRNLEEHYCQETVPTPDQGPG